MKKLYTRDKVLYFAGRAEGLHVDVKEPAGSDLRNIVSQLINDGLAERVAKDDSGSYFKLTVAGEISLLREQIKWRTSNGKDTTDHVRKLAELETKA